jgi:cullin 3
MTPSSWPVSKAPLSCILPSVLGKACNSFEQFYLTRHAGRKLIWLPSFGNADVEVTFKKRKHILNVSSFALIILLLFENIGKREFLTYGEIKNATEIPDSELQRNLYSLACAKFKVLRKHPSGRNINPDDSFSFNDGFSSPSQKIKINTVRARIESDEEREETHKSVKEERRYQIDVRT